MLKNVIILAAGRGTRMRSSLPKVLHCVAEKPLLLHVYDTAMQLNATKVNIIYGHGGEYVKDSLDQIKATWIEQSEQLGTGHAVQQAVPYIEDDELVVILYGDVPLISAQILSELSESAISSGFSLLTVNMADPFGYGRIVRDEKGSILKIVEQKDANAQEKEITEVNTGFMAVKGSRLKDWLSKLNNNNAQGEYYLTDIVGLAVEEGTNISHVTPDHEYEVLGVNNRLQLSELERIYQTNKAEELMLSGVTLRDPKRIDIRGELNCGQDVTIDVNVVFEGNVVLGDGVTIGANTCIKDSAISDNVKILSHCVIEGAQIGSGSSIGPFSRVRPDTKIADNARVGNYVEIKKSVIGEGSKVSHLSYIGDTDMGSGVNVGAGTITCNYDGANKFRTIIEDDVFIGSDTQIVAPVTVGKGSTIAAGTTLTMDTPEASLTLSRVKQRSIGSWNRPTKKNKP